MILTPTDRATIERARALLAVSNPADFAAVFGSEPGETASYPVMYGRAQGILGGLLVMIEAAARSASQPAGSVTP